MTADTMMPQNMAGEGTVDNGAIKDAMMNHAIMKDIHDIRPPVMVGMDPQLVKYGIWAAAGLGAAVLIFFLVRRLLQKRKKRTQLPAIPLIPPYEAAMTSLDRLAPRDSVKGAKAFYFELGRILKNYLGATWGIHCLELTTQELVSQLKSVNELPPSLKSDIAAFQDLCDPFRYAPDMMPEQTRMENDLHRGRQLIEAVEEAKNQAAAASAASAHAGKGA